MTSSQLNLTTLPGAQSLRHLAYAELRAALGELRIYETAEEIRFDERQLSQQLNVSRTTLRQALSQLESDGLIRIVPRRGVFVVRKTREQLREIVSVWCALEKLGARTLCETPEHAVSEELSRKLGLLEASLGAADATPFSRAEIALETLILNACRIELVAALTQRLGFHMRSMLHRFNTAACEQQHTLDEFRKLAGALQRRDGEAAERAVCRRHARLRAGLDLYLTPH